MLVHNVGRRGDRGGNRSTQAANEMLNRYEQGMQHRSEYRDHGSFNETDFEVGNNNGSGSSNNNNSDGGRRGSESTGGGVPGTTVKGPEIAKLAGEKHKPKLATSQQSFLNPKRWLEQGNKHGVLQNAGKDRLPYGFHIDKEHREKLKDLLGEEETEILRKVEEREDERAAQWRLRPLRRRVRLLFEDPHSSTPAYVLAVTILTMIIVSSIIFMVDSVDSVRNNDKVSYALDMTESVFIVCFTLEYLLRMWASEDWQSFPFESQNVIDFAAIIPWYVETIMHVSGHGEGGFNLGFLRLARVFRVFKLSRYGNKMQMVFDALNESRDILSMLMVNLAIIIIVFSSITYYAESPNNKDEFSNIPKTCWWCIVTVLTVGYGDMAPQSILGRCTAALLMILSLIVLALPITIIGSCFSNSWVAWKEDQKLKERLEMLPSTFKSLYPALTALAEDMSENNALLQEKSEELSDLLSKMHDALEKSRLGEQSTYLKDMSTLMESCMHLLSDNLVETHQLFDEILTMIRSRSAEGRRLRAHAAMVMDDAKTCMKMAFSNLFRSQATITTEEGELLDLRRYNGVMDVHVIGARGLAAKDMSGTSDPYVLVSHGEEVRKSEIMQKSLNPMWDEHMVLLINTVMTPIKVEVFDSDLISQDDPLGHVNIDIRDLVPEMRIEKWHELKDGKGGSIKLALTMFNMQSIFPNNLDDDDLMQSIADRVFSASASMTAGSNCSITVPKYNIVISKQPPPAMNVTERDHDRERERILAEKIKKSEMLRSKTMLGLEKRSSPSETEAVAAPHPEAAATPDGAPDARAGADLRTQSHHINTDE
ncbi:C2 domain-containing protein [Pseudoscourfieldia marina]